MAKDIDKLDVLHFYNSDDGNTVPHYVQDTAAPKIYIAELQIPYGYGGSDIFVDLVSGIVSSGIFHVYNNELFPAGIRTLVFGPVLSELKRDFYDMEYNGSAGANFTTTNPAQIYLDSRTFSNVGSPPVTNLGVNHKAGFMFFAVSDTTERPY